MINFFDIATPEEVTARFSLDATPLTLEELAEERAYLEQDSDANYEQLAGLYVDRGTMPRPKPPLKASVTKCARLIRPVCWGMMLSIWNGSKLGTSHHKPAIFQNFFKICVFVKM